MASSLEKGDELQFGVLVVEVEGEVGDGGAFFGDAPAEVFPGFVGFAFPDLVVGFGGVAVGRVGEVEVSEGGFAVGAEGVHEVAQGAEEGEGEE